MKLIILFLLILAASACTDSRTVYLCDSKGDRKYHFSDHCRGLSTCSHRLVQMTVAEAEKRGHSRCRWEK